ncbi:hypothetical protein PO413_20920 [Escherichia coli]
MRYKKVTVSYEPAITGNSKGGYSVEIKDRLSFNSPTERKYFESFFENNDENYNRVFINNFETIDTVYLKNLILFPKQKRIKEIDMLIFSPHKLGLSFMISEKLYNIITKFKLPPFNKIPAQINTFNTKYFLIGFPMIPKERIDLDKSIFFDTKKRSEFNFKSYDEFIKMDYSIIPKKIYPDVFYDVDVIGFQGKGLFFSDRLLDAIQNAGIVGLHIGDTEMEMNP